ncbi:uncharacterized protein LOC100883921 isoform X2 [Megachile rotundata]|uniref:uncharacterized protein LOC100883921 isoform X2 n=1 Tax=Megachile rotundata TaxID=143995 RepID=UPI003FD497CA
MSYRFICIPLITTLVCCIFSEKAATTELVNKQFIDGNQLASIVRAKNSSKISYIKSNDSVTNEKNLDKQPRTVNHRPESESRDNCCGSKYDSNFSTRPDSYYNHIPTIIGGRYSSKYGERLPTDRYGWQTQGQPPGWGGSTGRPGSESYLGNSLYQGSQAGDRFASRPKYGSESSRKPGSYDSTTSGGYDYGGYGAYGEYGFNRPKGYGGSTSSGGYGISGTFANGDEFGTAEPNYPEGNASLQPNIQAQKAVALKALAGVALIGAAAALAANPVLLPIGIVSGRRKRSSLPIARDDLYIDYLLKALKINATKAYDNEGGQQISPTCIARVVCEIQKRYWSDLEKKNNIFKKGKELESHFTNLNSDNVLEAEAINERIKKLIKAATVVASNGWHCSMFTCTVIKTTEAKNRFTFKV